MRNYSQPRMDLNVHGFPANEVIRGNFESRLKDHGWFVVRDFDFGQLKVSVFSEIGSLPARDYSNARG